MNILTPTQLGDSIFTSSYGGGSRLVNIARSADGKFAAEEKWSNKYQGYMTSPIVIDGHAYFYGRDRRFICFNLADGTEAWRTDERYGEYVSLVAQGSKMLALDMNGKLYFINANAKQFEKIDEMEVAKSETWAHLAVAGDELFIRDLDGVTAWKWK
jgi:outer membrane protein assembly factor BamB